MVIRPSSWASAVNSATVWVVLDEEETKVEAKLKSVDMATPVGTESIKLAILDTSDELLTEPVKE